MSSDPQPADVEIRFPDAGVPGSLYYHDETTPPTDELPLRGTVRVPAGSRIQLFLDEEAGEVDFGFLDAVPADLVEGLHVHSVHDDDLPRIARFTGVEMLSLSGDFGDTAAGAALQQTAQVHHLDLDSDGLTGDALALVPPTVEMVAVSSTRLVPATLAALGGLPDLNRLILARLTVDGALVDTLVALHPPLGEVQFFDIEEPPSVTVLERLLAGGLAVNGFGSTGASADAVARIVAEQLAEEDDDGDEWPDEEPAGGAAEHVRSISDEADLDALLVAGGAVLVDLTAEWCGPCQMLKPILEEIAVERDGHLDVVSVDIEEAPWIEDRFAIQAFPTLVFFDGASERGRLVGAQPKRVLDAMLTATSAD